MQERLINAANFLKKKFGEAEIGIILGSGLADSINLENPEIIGYENIPDFPLSTVKGHKNKMIFGTLANKKICVMCGRFHYYEGHSIEEIVFPIRVMKLIGIKTVILTNAAGGVNTNFKPGDIMLINDHINLNGINPLRCKNLDFLGHRFPDMTNAYSKRLLKIAEESAKELKIKVKSGVYMWFCGPSYETPAEIRAARILGADAVGMSTVPEVIAANHCGIEVLGISCITNMAAGILENPLSHTEVIKEMKKITAYVSFLIEKTISKL